MKIVHIVLGKANPDRMNGVNKVVYQLATEQVRSGSEVELWGITRNTQHDYGKRTFKTILFKETKNKFSISKELKKEIAQSQNTVFHLHGGWIPTYWAIARTMSRHQKKAVLTPHGAYNTIAMQGNSWVKKIYFKIIEKTVLQAMHKIHCIGDSEKEGLEKIYPNTKQYLIPYGFKRPEVKPTRSEKNESFIVGFVGRIDIHTKGLDILVQAFAKFAKNRNTKLWIVGDGSDRHTLQEWILKEDIAAESVLWGSKFGTEKDNIIKQMDVFTHPSRNEGLPTAVLEAASFGVPSIVTKATNVGEYIVKYNAGLCIANEDIDVLCQALEKLYTLWQNQQMDVLRDGTQKMLSSAFDWQKLVYRYDTELYQ